MSQSVLKFCEITFSVNHCLHSTSRVFTSDEIAGRGNWEAHKKIQDILQGDSLFDKSQR